MENVIPIDPSDDLNAAIRSVCDRRDRNGEEYSPDDVLDEIRLNHPEAILRKGTALALKACRRLIAQFFKRRTGEDGSDFRQLKLPGIAIRLPSHISYPAPDPTDPTKTRMVTRHTKYATVEQMERSLEGCRINTRRCIEMEQQRERVIDLLKAECCNSLAEYEQKKGLDAA